MEYIYYPDHDARYAHLSEGERRNYPDEVRFGPFRCIRVKTYAELTGEIPVEIIAEISGDDIETVRRRARLMGRDPDTYRLNVGVDRLLLSKDVPITRAFYY